ncbi:unnamed protein product [Rotaria socialis]|uniref:ATP synthase F0 subunit 8 n=1 Tax=Rotaria socialis TaxID=392032 RepID=A0A821E3K9_9BILA|nr:unnamed protein product [Rotaria socialis]CAF3359950.1 unnamed protein product [Rotaria socialis]CAF3376420.1 unnamed protein product [Rotaria socialis]CAF3692407.1 unnamed protein product [Rotaria socialis]CAF4289022.1 unnamed protein product [Rotaria socialis]
MLLMLYVIYTVVSWGTRETVEVVNKKNPTKPNKKEISKPDSEKRRTNVLNNLFWADGQQRSFLHQIIDVIKHVFRPAAK